MNTDDSELDILQTGDLENKHRKQKKTKLRKSWKASASQTRYLHADAPADFLENM